MKTDIHPTYFPQAKVVCACGNEFVVGSTVQDLRVELCSKCHPFYTGKQKLLDTSRRLEKYTEKVAAKESLAASVTGKKAKTAKRAAAKEAKKNAKAPATLNEA